jgi:hypothetical protein
MNGRRFARWNWEFDFGEGELAAALPSPLEYAIALYDHRGRLYRVESRQRIVADRADDDAEAYSAFAYEYFCDLSGRILQKRDVDEQGSVFLIVDFQYDVENDTIIETAWWPHDGTCRSAKRCLSRSPQPSSLYTSAGGSG